MNKRWWQISVVALASTAFFVAGLNFLTQEQEKTAWHKLKKEQRIEEALADNFRRTMDWDLGYPPANRLQEARKVTKALQAKLELTKNDLTKARYKEHGPNNIGGRTRTILVDQNDPSGKTVWAGAVSGGLWKTNDITAADPAWTPVGDVLENLTVGSMVQDPNNPQIMYLGTGELYAGGTGEFVGTGIFKTTDGGENWALIPSTEPTNLSSAFNFTQDMIITPEGVLYAATNLGLYRTSTGGDEWERVLLGTIHEITYTPSTGMFFAAVDAGLRRSATGDNFDWQNLRIKPGFPSGLQRVEVSICKADPNVIYLIGSLGGDASNIYKSEDGGESWTDRGIPQSREPNMANFTRGQAYYDLTIAVDPYDCNRVLVGGIDLYRSFNGGANWQQIAHWFGGFGLQNVHADQHMIMFDEDRRGVVYFGNDGGIWRSKDGGTIIDNRNLGYNVTQFYAGDIHPEAYKSYFIGGTQDNGSLRLDKPGISDGVEVLGGDGFFCHIDQKDPNIQMVSLYFAAYGLSTDGGQSFSNGASFNGAFVSPSDYDDDMKLLYTQTFDGDIYRWNVMTNESDVLDMQSFATSGNVSAVHVDKTTPNRVYVATFAGDVVRMDDAHEGTLIPTKRLNTFSGVPSSINVNPDNSEHLLVTISSYGARPKVLESKDGGATWDNVTGNLPDMPVRWGVFVPSENGAQVAIATELGVWLAETLNGANTEWIPPAIGRGIPLVRTDMLQLRASDNVLYAATYGRGMFTTDVFARPKVILGVDRISYVDADILFDGTLSFGATDYLWEFGDGTTDTVEQVTHQYSKIGEYDVALTINGDLTERSTIKILPNKSVPYTDDEDNFSGDFESNPEDYGVYTVSGSSFERGETDRRGKSGTHSGDNAFVLGLDEDFYQPNTETMLYMPNFDLSEEGIYEFSFWSKYLLQQGFDGFQVQYSTDKGKNWRVLGDADDDNWYDFENTTVENAAFPVGSSFFGRSRGNWTESFIDISFLSGNADVAFRFLFKSDGGGNHPGVAIDDVEVRKYDGQLETDIINAEAEYLDFEDAEIRWVTQPEYQAREFIIERSYNGRDYEEIEKVSAIGKTTGRIQEYEVRVDGFRNLYFFRIRSINQNNRKEYYHEFVTEPLVIRRDFEDVEVFRYYPNPITDYIEFTFTDIVNDEVNIELFDASGKLLYEEAKNIQGEVYTRFDFGHLTLPVGVYFLTYQIGDRDVETIKLLAAE